MEILYKKNTQGKIETWKIGVQYLGLNKYSNAEQWVILTMYGEHGGKKIIKEEIVDEGKNEGKKNATTPEQQARAMAKAKWVKQLKKGYVKTLEDAKAGKTDEIITGGVLPMLAHKYQDHKDKIEFPVKVQPKLDGERCIAIKQHGQVTLWTRTRKPITSCPHIVEQLENILAIYDDLFLDGELYLHEQDNFEKIMSAVRKQNPSEESKQIEYHVYDTEILGDLAQPFYVRNEFLNDLSYDWSDHVHFVETDNAHSHADLERIQEKYIHQGYEGIMIRNPNSVYECKRSKGLLKMKTFEDAEFKIIGVEKGNDNAVVFICMIGKQSFKATMSGDKKENQKYLTNHKLWQGKKLNVKYQNLTNANKVPRFPVGVRIREDLN